MRRQCNGAKRYTEATDLSSLANSDGRGAFHRPKKVAWKGSWREWKRECRYKYTKRRVRSPSAESLRIPG